MDKLPHRVSSCVLFMLLSPEVIVSTWSEEAISCYWLVWILLLKDPSISLRVIAGCNHVLRFGSGWFINKQAFYSLILFSKIIPLVSVPSGNEGQYLGKTESSWLLYWYQKRDFLKQFDFYWTKVKISPLFVRFSGSLTGRSAHTGSILTPGSISRTYWCRDKNMIPQQPLMHCHVYFWLLLLFVN